MELETAMGASIARHSHRGITPLPQISVQLLRLPRQSRKHRTARALPWWWTVGRLWVLCSAVLAVWSDWSVSWCGVRGGTLYGILRWRPHQKIRQLLPGRAVRSHADQRKEIQAARRPSARLGGKYSEVESWLLPVCYLRLNFFENSNHACFT